MNLKKVILSLTICIVLTLDFANATTTCSFKNSSIDNFKIFSSVFKNVKTLKTRVINRDTSVFSHSEYFFEHIEITPLDHLLLTTPELNPEGQKIGLDHDVYIGFDIKSQELDVYLFLFLKGLDGNDVKIFKEAHNNDKCIYKSQPYPDALGVIEVISPTSFSIGWYNLNDGSAELIHEIMFSE